MDISSMLLCTDADPTVGFFDFSIAPEILYYAYIPVVMISIALGTFVFIKDKRSHISTVLFLITLLFGVFIMSELIQWVAVPAGVIYFAWAISLLLHFVIVLLTVYFSALFVRKKDVAFIYKLIFALLTVPVLLFLPTDLNLVGFDIDWCEGVTGPLWMYLYGFETLCAVGLLISAVYIGITRKSVPKGHLAPSLYVLIGSALFLLVFFASYFFGDLTGIYGVNFVGPIGMLIFIGVLSYIIVRFKVFNARLIAAQALMLSLWALIGSLIFVSQSTTTAIVAGFTLAFAVILGMVLVLSIKKTVKQKEEIEALVKKLEKANDRLQELDKMKSEFVSIASHQLRSPLTSIRGYASMLVEGSYGRLPAKAQQAVERIAESSRFMSSSVEDYLNVSRIQAGNMKYVYSDFNLKDVAEQIVDDTRQLAMKKGLLLLFRSDLSKKGIVHADLGKTRQVIDNLVNNALKYTPKGSITIFVHDAPRKKIISVDIIDTGIGMSEHTIDDMFEKFERAHNANAVNVTGTGLGLYIARKIAREMGGEVTASSKGEGQGSVFTFTLPLQM